MSTHHVETFIHDSGCRDWGWQCFTCGEEDCGYDSMSKAEQAGEHHRIEVATQEMIDAGGAAVTGREGAPDGAARPDEQAVAEAWATLREIAEEGCDRFDQPGDRTCRYWLDRSVWRGCCIARAALAAAGPDPVREALEECRDMLARHLGDRSQTARVLIARADAALAGARPAAEPVCRYCGADCSEGRSWDGDAYACPTCSDRRAAENRAAAHPAAEPAHFLRRTARNELAQVIGGVPEGVWWSHRAAEAALAWMAREQRIRSSAAARPAGDTAAAGPEPIELAEKLCPVLDHLISQVVRDVGDPATLRNRAAVELAKVAAEHRTPQAGDTAPDDEQQDVEHDRIVSDARSDARDQARQKREERARADQAVEAAAMLRSDVAALRDAGNPLAEWAAAITPRSTYLAWGQRVSLVDAWRSAAGGEQQ